MKPYLTDEDLADVPPPLRGQARHMNTQRNALWHQGRTPPTSDLDPRIAGPAMQQPEPQTAPANMDPERDKKEIDAIRGMAARPQMDHWRKVKIAKQTATLDDKNRLVSPLFPESRARMKPRQGAALGVV